MSSRVDIKERPKSGVNKQTKQKITRNEFVKPKKSLGLMTKSYQFPWHNKNKTETYNYETGLYRTTDQLYLRHERKNSENDRFKKKQIYQTAIKDENPENAYENISSDHLKTIEELTGKVKQLEQLNKQLKVSKRQMQKTSQKEINELTQKIKKLQQQIGVSQNAKKETEGLENRIKELEGQKKKYRALYEKYFQENTTNELNYESLKTEMAQKQHKSKDLQQDLNNEKKTVIQLKKQRKQPDQAHQQLIDTLTKEIQTSKLKEEQFDQIKKAFKVINKSLEKKVEDLSNRNMMLENQINQLKVMKVDEFMESLAQE